MAFVLLGLPFLVVFLQLGLWARWNLRGPYLNRVKAYAKLSQIEASAEV